MAINPESQYPGKIAPSSAAYPWGQARNFTAPGDGTGTPWEAGLVNDLFGLMQSILDGSQQTPTGTPDSVGSSQLYLGLGAMAPTLADAKAANYQSGQKVFTKGYYTNNDGGAARYICKTAVEAASDGDVIDEYGNHTMTSGKVLILVQDVPGVFFAKQYGCKVDNSTNDYNAITAAIAAAALAASGAQGAVVQFPTGVALSGSRIVQPNRVTLRGPNGRGFVLKPHASFADTYFIHAVNGTSSMFGARLEDMHIDVRGFNMTAAILSQAWQETCGMYRVVVQWDGTTRNGLHYTNGYGGAASLPIEDCEFFADSTNVSAAGIRVDSISIVGGFVLAARNITMAGTVTNNLPIAISMVNDSAVVGMLHVEYCAAAVVMAGAGSLSADTITGSSNAVGDLVTIGGSFTGQVSLRNMIPNGATGSTFKDNVSGTQNIAASEGMIPSYEYKFSGFMAVLTADQSNVTGNGTEATVICDSVSYDRRGEYDNTTGIFTADRTGKYNFTGTIRINPTLSVTTCVIKLVTTSRTYYVFRGDTDSLRDGSGLITFNGSFIGIPLSAGNTARLTVLITGLAGDTVDINSDETIFAGEWANR